MRAIAPILFAILVSGCAAAGGGTAPTASQADPGTSGIPASSIDAEPSAAVIPTAPWATPSDTPSAFGSAVPTDGGASPPACATGTRAEGLPSLAAMVVAVEALNVREGPCLAAPRLDDGRVSTPLQRGAVVVVLAGPVVNDGHRWYAVGLDTEPGTVPAAGWVAAGTTTDGWLRAADARCPDATFLDVAALSQIRRLVCFGDGSLALTAHQAAIPKEAGYGGSCQGEGRDQPLWLLCWSVNYEMVNGTGGPADGPDVLHLFFDPARGIEPIGLADVGTIGPSYAIRGHFSDPASRACSNGLDPTTLAFYEEWITCATQFVVESLDRMP
jgi:hypothetical protein